MGSRNASFRILPDSSVLGTSFVSSCHHVALCARSVLFSSCGLLECFARGVSECWKLRTRYGSIGNSFPLLQCLGEWPQASPKLADILEWPSEILLPFSPRTALTSAIRFWAGQLLQELMGQLGNGWEMQSHS